MIKQKYNKEEAKHLFFTSDTHFYHESIIRLCNRPYSTVEEMNNDLIHKWNSVVGPDDIVFHLGDFSWCGSDKTKKICEQLNGHKCLILGNHDHEKMYNAYLKLFDLGVYQQLLLNIDNRNVYLNHYPFLCYAGTYRNSKDMVWQLYGHVHSGPGATGLDLPRLEYCFKTQYDVGVDNNNYTPISWEQVCNKINAKEVKKQLTFGLKTLKQDLNNEN